MLATAQQPTGSGHLARARRAIGIEGGEHSRCSPPHLRNAEKSTLSHPVSARDTGTEPFRRDWPNWHFGPGSSGWPDVRGQPCLKAFGGPVGRAVSRRLFLACHDEGWRLARQCQWPDADGGWTHWPPARALQGAAHPSSGV